MKFETLSMQDLKELHASAVKAENEPLADKLLAQMMGKVIQESTVTTPNEGGKVSLLPQAGLFEPNDKGENIIFSCRLAPNSKKTGHTGSFKAYFVKPTSDEGNGDQKPPKEEPDKVTPGDENNNDDQPF